MEFRDYLKTLGDERAAELFGVKPRTVRSWRFGERAPRLRQARTIVERTQGAITLAEIYAPPTKQ